MDADNKKPFKIKDITRNIKKAVVAGTLEELRIKIAEKFEKGEQELPTVHLDSDGTEIDDEEYFRTLDENTELIAVFPGEHWIDPTHYVTITSQEADDTTDAAQRTARIQHLVGQLQNNLCNVSVISDPDLDSLSNMDPNSLVDITGRDFMEQLKDSAKKDPKKNHNQLMFLLFFFCLFFLTHKHTPLCAKRNAEDRINLLKLLKEGAIFCSERYPEDAEDIDLEISRQMNAAANANAATTLTTTNTTDSPTTKLNPAGKTKTITTTTTTTTITTAVNMETQETNVTKTIEEVQNMNVEQVIINTDANAVAAADANDDGVASVMLSNVTEITVVAAAAATTAAAASAVVSTRASNKANDI